MSTRTIPQTCPVHHANGAAAGKRAAKTGTHKRPPRPSLPDTALLPLEFARNQFEPWGKLARKYGDVVDLSVPGLTVTLLSHPDHVEHILVNEIANYPKHDLLRAVMRPLGALALPVNDDEPWRRVRQGVNPRLTSNALAAISPTVSATSVEYIDEWGQLADTGEQVDLTHQIGVVGMATLMKTLFDIPLTRDEIDGAVHACDQMGKYFLTQVATLALPEFVGSKIEGSNSVYSYLLDLIDRLIAYRRANPTPPDADPDMISLLLGVRFADGSGLTEEQLRTETLGLVFAGFDTTALAAAWTVGLLALHPEAQQRVYDEVDALGDKVVEHDDLAKVPFLRNCFDEAQRLQAVPAWLRQARNDDEIGGYRIPAGSTVVFSPYALQRDPRFWRNPEAFDPDRFDRDPISRYAFLPFNAGNRKCAGSKMAYVEGLTILITAYQRYEFRTRKGWKPRNKVQIATGLKGGLPVTIHRRTR